VSSLRTPARSFNIVSQHRMRKERYVTEDRCDQLPRISEERGLQRGVKGGKIQATSSTVREVNWGTLIEINAMESR